MLLWFPGGQGGRLGPANPMDPEHLPDPGKVERDLVIYLFFNPKELNLMHHAVLESQPKLITGIKTLSEKD